MSEPATGAAAAYGVGKALASIPVVGVIASIIGAVIVMAATHPRSKREWTIALFATFSASIFGGAFVLDYWHLHDRLGTLASGLVYLLCALPGWVAVRGFFAYTERDSSKGILDYVKEIRQAWKGQ